MRAHDRPGMADRHDPYVSLRNPNFLWYVASLVVLTLGTQIQATVVAWQVYALTKDPLSLGLVGLAEALPFIGAALYAGHVADRYDRKALSMIALAVQLVCGAALLVLTVYSTRILARTLLPIYAIVSVSGLARSFLLPARSALGADLVPRALFPSAVAWRTGVWQVAAVVQSQSGNPVNIVTSNASLNGLPNTVRPDVTGPIRILVSSVLYGPE